MTAGGDTADDFQFDRFFWACIGEVG